MTSTNDTKLEQTFADMAYASLRDKSSALIDYLVGFQMLKQEQDGMRAVGIFGFEVDENFYYVPVFFLNGEIKGIDAIYSVDSDLFVPITDEWVNTLIKKQKSKLGEPSKDDKVTRGVRYPTYTRLKIIPSGGGFTSTKLSSAMMAPRTIDGYVSFIDGLRMISGTGQFKQALFANPKLRECFETFYNILDLTPSEKVKKAASKETKVTIVNGITDEGVEDMTDAERDAILAGGTVVMDKRPEVEKTRLYRTETKKVLTTPTGGGVYDVLYNDGTVHPTIIGHITNLDKVYVYCPDKKCSGVVRAQCILAVRQYDNAASRQFIVKNTQEAGAIKPYSSGVFISDTGEASLPFGVDQVVTGLDDLVVARVDVCYDAGPRNYPNLTGFNGDYPDYHGYHGFKGEGRLNNGNPFSNVEQFSKRPNFDTVLIRKSGGSTPIYTGNKCIIPSDHFRWLSPEVANEEQLGAYANVSINPSVFGDHNTLMAALDKFANDLSIWKTGSDIHVKIAGEVVSGRDKDTLRHLILNVGFGEDEARWLIKSANFNTSHFKFEKCAATDLLPFPSIDDTAMGGEMSAYHSSQIPWRAVEKAQPEETRELYQYYSPFADGGTQGGGGQGGEQGSNTFSVLEQASQTGDKEVFDAAGLASLIKCYNPADLVDKFIPTITAGMDRLGRLLFVTYWHYDKFIQRFGETDLGEFVDNLRSAFEQLGDIVSFMRKQTLGGDPEYYGIGTTNAFSAESEG